jgi:hypothetical protein
MIIPPLGSKKPLPTLLSPEEIPWKLKNLSNQKVLTGS